MRFEQILYRIYYNLRRKIRFPKIDFQDINFQNTKWVEPQWRKKTFLTEKKVKFLNIEYEINKIDDWNTVTQDKLWLYNLHYFDGLLVRCSNISDLELQKYWIKKWIKENKYENGIGWEPYTISLRIVNWIKWLLINKIDDSEIIKSILVQSHVLDKKIEFHILANHLFSNIKAQLFVCLINPNKKTLKLKKKYYKLLSRELDEQFLEDGTHFELSSMYQGIMTWDLLDIYQLFKLFPDETNEKLIEKLNNIVLKALNAQFVLTHPDGKPSFFNDAAFEIAPILDDLIMYAKNLGIQLEKIDVNKNKTVNTLLKGGYSKIVKGKNCVIFDHGNLAIDYQSGHAHADTLSVEWSVDDERVLVNSGTSTYENNQTRLNQRKTRSHNTVSVNDTDSSEVWGSFRVAKRAKVRNFLCRDINNIIQIEAEHDGYKNLKQPVYHHRKLEIYENEFIVFDKLNGNFETAKIYWYIHPDISIVETKEKQILMKTKKGIIILMRSDQKINVNSSKWFPEFNVSIENVLLTIDLKQKDNKTSFLITN